jgi:hypothetical protein
MLLKRSIPPRKWGLLLLLIVGVALVQVPDASPEQMAAASTSTLLNSLPLLQGAGEMMASMFIM